VETHGNPSKTSKIRILRSLHVFNNGFIVGGKEFLHLGVEALEISNTPTKFGQDLWLHSALTAQSHMFPRVVLPCKYEESIEENLMGIRKVRMETGKNYIRPNAQGIRKCK
jgi:hypothetical protein